MSSNEGINCKINNFLDSEVERGIYNQIYIYVYIYVSVPASPVYVDVLKNERMGLCVYFLIEEMSLCIVCRADYCWPLSPLCDHSLNAALRITLSKAPATPIRMQGGQSTKRNREGSRQTMMLAKAFDHGCTAARRAKNLSHLKRQIH